MKFENILNSFNPAVKTLDLTKKEIDYISMLISGVDRYRITELLSITNSDIDELYKKFGLVDDRSLEIPLCSQSEPASALHLSALSVRLPAFSRPEFRFDLAEQMKAVVSFNNILTEDILNEVYTKYNVPECRNFAELKRKAPKRSEKRKIEEHEALTSFMKTVKDRMD